MQRLLGSIDSLNHLAAFEAAARHGSFTRAAAELNVSQPAVSQSIRKLETAIGVPLFHRRHRSLALTTAGEMLADDVGEGLSRIASTIRHLRRLSVSNHVTLSVSTAFANYWMVPRLQSFRRKHPTIDLRLQTSDKDLDLAQEGISLGVRRGSGEWRGYSSGRIARERLTAVASPAWATQRGAPSDIEALAAAPLIHLEEPHRARPTWRDWFAALGHSYRDHGGGLRLNDYALVLQAAMAGEGVAMGYRHIVGALEAQHLLANLGEWVVETEASFFLVWSDRTELSDDAKTVRDWILDRSAQEAL